MRRLLIVMAILLLLIICLFSSARCQNDEIGVSQGDVFTYEYKELFYSNQTDFPRQNTSSPEQLKIAYVSDSLVNITETRHFGQEEQILEHTVNITDGYLCSDNCGLIFFIPPNLDAGDSFYFMYPNSLTIEEIVLRTYEGESRETNHFSVVSSDGYREDFYFDRETGVLVEDTYTSGVIPPDASYGVYYPWIQGSTFIIKSSSRWVVPEFPSFLPLPVLMIAVAFGALLYRKKLGKPIFFQCHLSMLAKWKTLCKKIGPQAVRSISTVMCTK
jgi:hypothetical protein